jgi:hypothetical protein
MARPVLLSAAALLLALLLAAPPGGATWRTVAAAADEDVQQQQREIYPGSSWHFNYPPRVYDVAALDTNAAADPRPAGSRKVRGAIACKDALRYVLNIGLAVCATQALLALGRPCTSDASCEAGEVCISTRGRGAVCVAEEPPRCCAATTATPGQPCRGCRRARSSSSP